MSRRRKIKKPKRNARRTMIVEGKLMKNKRGFGSCALMMGMMYLYLVEI